MGRIEGERGNEETRSNLHHRDSQVSNRASRSRFNVRTLPRFEIAVRNEKFVQIGRFDSFGKQVGDREKPRKPEKGGEKKGVLRWLRGKCREIRSSLLISSNKSWRPAPCQCGTHAKLTGV